MTTKNKTSRNVYLSYLVIIVGFLVIRVIGALQSYGVLPKATSLEGYLLNAFIQIGLLFGLSIFMFSGLQKQKVKTTFRFYGYKKISLKAVFITLVIGVIIYFLNIFVASFFDTFLSSIGYSFSQGESMQSYPVSLLVLNLLCTAVLPAICEETAHRGMLLKGNSGLSSKMAIIISGLLFGLMHLNIEQFFYATLIGFFLGYITLLCDSIYPAMIVHFVNNGISVFMGYSSFHKGGLSKLMSSFINFLNYNVLLGYVFLTLLIGLLVWLLAFLVKRLFRATAGKNIIDLQEAMYKEIMKKDYLSDLEASRAEIRGDYIQDNHRINLEEIYINNNIKLGYMTELDHELLASKGKGKLDKVASAFMWTCFALTIAGTLLTLIRGLLI